MQKKEFDQSDYYQRDDHQGQLEDIYARQRLRKQAYNRKTQYLHPQVNFFDHQPINSKQSEELRHQLISLYKPKVEYVRTRIDHEQMSKDYEKHYEEFIKMTLKNEIQQRQLTQSIGQMHEIAQVLLNPPSLNDNNLYLHSKAQPTSFQQEEINRIFDMYELAHKEGHQIQQNHAEQTIKRAKQFLRDRYT